jgi:hypothetical protein
MTDRSWFRRLATLLLDKLAGLGGLAIGPAMAFAG